MENFLTSFANQSGGKRNSRKYMKRSTARKSKAMKKRSTLKKIKKRSTARKSKAMKKRSTARKTKKRSTKRKSKAMKKRSTARKTKKRSTKRKSKAMKKRSTARKTKKRSTARKSKAMKKRLTARKTKKRSTARKTKTMKKRSTARKSKTMKKRSTRKRVYNYTFTKHPKINASDYEVGVMKRGIRGLFKVVNVNGKNVWRKCDKKNGVPCQKEKIVSAPLFDANNYNVDDVMKGVGGFFKVVNVDNKNVWKQCNKKTGVMCKKDESFSFLQPSIMSSESYEPRQSTETSGVSSEAPLIDMAQDFLL
jgi:hypothetical protein